MDQVKTVPGVRPGSVGREESSWDCPRPSSRTDFKTSHLESSYGALRPTRNKFRLFWTYCITWYTNFQKKNLKFIQKNWIDNRLKKIFVVMSICGCFDYYVIVRYYGISHFDVHFLNLRPRFDKSDLIKPFQEWKLPKYKKIINYVIPVNYVMRWFHGHFRTLWPRFSIIQYLDTDI